MCWQALKRCVINHRSGVHKEKITQWFIAPSLPFLTLFSSLLHSLPIFLCFGDLGGFLHSSLKLNQSAGTGSKCDLSWGGAAVCSQSGGMVKPNGNELQGFSGDNCITQPAGLYLNVIHILQYEWHTKWCMKVRYVSCFGWLARRSDNPAGQVQHS